MDLLRFVPEVVFLVKNKRELASKRMTDLLEQKREGSRRMIKLKFKYIGVMGCKR